MKPQISLKAFGVDTMERSLRFYRGGFELSNIGIVGTEQKGRCLVLTCLGREDFPRPVGQRERQREKRTWVGCRRRKQADDLAGARRRRHSLPKM